MGNLSIELRRGSAALVIAVVSIVVRYELGIHVYDTDVPILSGTVEWFVNVGVLVAPALAIHDFYALNRRRIGRKWRPGGLWQPTHRVTVAGEATYLVMLVPHLYPPTDASYPRPDDHYSAPAYVPRFEHAFLFGYTLGAWKDGGAPQFEQATLDGYDSYDMGLDTPTHPELGVGPPRATNHSGEKILQNLGWGGSWRQREVWYREWFRFDPEHGARALQGYGWHPSLYISRRPVRLASMLVGSHLPNDRVERLSQKEARALRE